MNRLYNFTYQNIVIMDDESCLLWMYERLLENYPVNIFAFTNAEEAMKCVWKLNGDVALFTTDHQHMGISVCQMAIRMKRLYPHIRFVVISAYGGEAPRLVKEGLVDELMYKPFDPDDYRQLIGKYIRLSQEQ